ncbi:hypothetical protein D8S78_21430 [Natrialba swarupiae]|nr:hypothetical protein [Natrialba swarupiae]
MYGSKRNQTSAANTSAASRRPSRLPTANGDCRLESESRVLGTEHVSTHHWSDSLNSAIPTIPTAIPGEPSVRRRKREHRSEFDDDHEEYRDQDQEFGGEVRIR